MVSLYMVYTWYNVVYMYIYIYIAYSESAAAGDPTSEIMKYKLRMHII